MMKEHEKREQTARGWVKGREKTLIITILSVIALVAIALIMNVYGKKEYTFAEGLKQVQELDAKYNTSFYQEELNETMVEFADIQLLLEDIKEFEESLDRKAKSPHSEALRLFIDVRKMMLTAEWYFQKGQELGDQGITIDEAGFSCREAQEVLDAAFFFNESIHYAWFAQSELDDLLYSYQEIPQLHALVGTDESKTRFYHSPLDYYALVVRSNIASVKKHCPIEIPPLQSTMAQRFLYERKDPRQVRKELLEQGFEVEGIFNESVKREDFILSEKG